MEEDVGNGVKGEGGSKQAQTQQPHSRCSVYDCLAKWIMLGRFLERANERLP
jgi:hypothetical protein